ncbi:hypothetical protein ENVG_00137 [Emiliania huxleyi virus 84]|nr:hypothetical protein ENVG_00137 [Emiliania huxleyi virus 84]
MTDQVAKKQKLSVCNPDDDDVMEEANDVMGCQLCEDAPKLNYLLMNNIKNSNLACVFGIPQQVITLFLAIVSCHMKNRYDVIAARFLLKNALLHTFPGIVFNHEAFDHNFDQDRPEGYNSSNMYDALVNEMPNGFHHYIVSFCSYLTKKSSLYYQEKHDNYLAQRGWDIQNGYRKETVLMKNGERGCGVDGCNVFGWRSTSEEREKHRKECHPTCQFVTFQQSTRFCFGLTETQNDCMWCFKIIAGGKLKSHMQTCDKNPYFIYKSPGQRNSPIKAVDRFDDMKSRCENEQCKLLYTEDEWKEKIDSIYSTFLVQCIKTGNTFTSPSINNIVSSGRSIHGPCPSCHPGNVLCRDKFNDVETKLNETEWTLIWENDEFRSNVHSPYIHLPLKHTCGKIVKTTTLDSLLNGGALPHCSDCGQGPLCKRPIEDINALFELHNVQILEYPHRWGSRTKLPARCTLHPHAKPFDVTYHGTIDSNGRSCPCCQAIYLGEETIRNLLEFIKCRIGMDLTLQSIKIGPRSPKGTPTRYDIYIHVIANGITYHIVIEVDGRHHFVPKYNNDDSYYRALCDRLKEEAFVASDNSFLLRIDRDAINTKGQPQDNNDTLVIWICKVITNGVNSCVDGTSKRVHTYSTATLDVYSDSSNFYGKVHSLDDNTFASELAKFEP